MIQMSSKEYLSQYGTIKARLRLIDSNIDRLRKDIRALGDISISSAWPDGQPHGTKIGDPTSSKAIQLINDMGSLREKRERLRGQLLEYEYQQIQERSKLWSLGMEITEKLSSILSIDDDNAKVYHDILWLRYIQDMRWEEIAVSIGYTYRHTTRLHGEALRVMEEVLNE